MKNIASFRTDGVHNFFSVLCPLE